MLGECDGTGGEIVAHAHTHTHKHTHTHTHTQAKLMVAGWETKVHYINILFYLSIFDFFFTHRQR